jgi:hypothetical protein
MMLMANSKLKEQFLYLEAFKMAAKMAAKSTAEIIF